MVEKYIGFSVAVSNVWLGSACDKKSPKMVIIAKERCNPKLMSRVMADVPFSTTCVFPLLGAMATTLAFPALGIAAQRMRTYVFICTRTVVSASYEYLVCVYYTYVHLMSS